MTSVLHEEAVPRSREERRVRMGYALGTIWIVLLALNLALRDRWGPWVIVGVVPWSAWCFGTAAVAATVWFLVRKTLLVVTGTAFACACVFVGSGVSVMSVPLVAATDRDLAIVQWNTEFWDVGEDSQLFEERLRSFDADVYVLQEHGEPAPGGAITGISDLSDVRQWFPDFHIARSHDLLTLSRYPIIDQAYDPAGGSLETTLDTPGGPLRVFNVHTIAPYDLSGAPWTSRFWDAIVERDKVQRAQFSWLSEKASETLPAPTVILGDFNVTAGMRDLAARFPGFRDLSRTPWLGTWGVGGVSAWRLDWQLGSADVCMSSSWVGDINPSSDHAPTTLTVRPRLQGETC